MCVCVCECVCEAGLFGGVDRLRDRKASFPGCMAFRVRKEPHPPPPLEIYMYNSAAHTHTHTSVAGTILDHSP